MTHDAAMKNTDFLKLAEEACRGIRDFPLSDKDCKMLDWLREEMFEAGLFKQNDRGTFVLQGDYFRRYSRRHTFSPEIAQQILNMFGKTIRV